MKGIRTCGSLLYLVCDIASLPLSRVALHLVSTRIKSECRFIESEKSLHWENLLSWVAFVRGIWVFGPYSLIEVVVW
jgi:hypothetical protein